KPDFNNCTTEETRERSSNYISDFKIKPTGICSNYSNVNLTTATLTTSLEVMTL
ncbi:23850_t:CDS:1, partial [Gigaspora margarita]